MAPTRTTQNGRPGGTTRTTRPTKAAALGLAALLLALGLIGFVGSAASARPHVRHYWQYDMGTFDHSWKSEPKLRRTFKHWLKRRQAELQAEADAQAAKEARAELKKAKREARRDGEDPRDVEIKADSTQTDKIVVPRKEIRAKQKELEKRYLAMHFHEATGNFSGKATWFNDSHGACGKPLRGYYAASRTLPCGTKLAVRGPNGRYVHVTVLDRGPFTGAVLDLSKSAFKQIAPLGAGVINVRATRLRG
jgi:hypothetical protein